MPSIIPIRIGNQTSCNAPAQLPYEFALRHHFDAFEWFSDKAAFGWCEDDSGPEERAGLRRAGQEHGILFSVHAPCAADPTTAAGRADLLKSIRFAADIGAGLVNFHMFPEHDVAGFVDSLARIIEAARSARVRLSLENTPATSPEHVNAVFDVLASIPETVGHVGMCLDSGHANLYAGTRNDYLRYVDQLGRHVPIIHWHAHENWGDRDSHLPLFTGPSARDPIGIEALIARLRSRGFRGSVVLEQWPQPPSILVDVRQRLAELFA